MRNKYEGLCYQCGMPGMTLRQYYAAHCPISWEESQNYNSSRRGETEFFAAIRFEYADAMIAAEGK